MSVLKPETAIRVIHDALGREQKMGQIARSIYDPPELRWIANHLRELADEVDPGPEGAFA